MAIQRFVSNGVARVSEMLRLPARFVKQVPYYFRNLQQPIPSWTMVDFPSYAEEGYAGNPIIYSAIAYKVRAVTSAPARAYQGTRKRPVALDPRSNEVAALFSRPNYHQSWIEFQSQLTVYLNISGNAYIYLDRDISNQVPVEMYTLRPDRVRILINEKRIVGYAYYPDGVFEENRRVPILPQNLIHIKLPNPLDRYEGLGYGLSPISSIAKVADVDNMVTSTLKNFFDHGMMLSGLLKFNVKLKDDDITKIRKRWNQIYGSYEKWTEVGILDSGAEYQRLTPTFKEMGFKDIDERSETRMLGPFGVPPILVGSRTGMEHSTYSNYEEARKAFWEDTMIPELRLYQDEFTAFFEQFGVFILYDVTEVPAFKKSIPELIRAAKDLWDMGVPSKIALETVGIDVEDYEEDRTAFLPANVIPADSVDGQAEDEATVEIQSNAEQVMSRESRKPVKKNRLRSWSQ